MNNVEVICAIKDIEREMLSKENVDFKMFYDEVMMLVYNVAGEEIASISEHIKKHTEHIETITSMMGLKDE